MTRSFATDNEEISSPNNIVSPTVTRERNDLTPTIHGLGAYRQGQCARHGAVVERTDQPPLSIHRQIAGGPHHRGAYVDGEHRIVGGHPTGFCRNIFRPYGGAIAIVDRECVQR